MYPPFKANDSKTVPQMYSSTILTRGELYDIDKARQKDDDVFSGKRGHLFRTYTGQRLHNHPTVLMFATRRERESPSR